MKTSTHVSILIDLSTFIPLSGGSEFPPSPKGELASNLETTPALKGRNAPIPVYLDGATARGRAGRVANEREKGMFLMEELRGSRRIDVRKADIVDRFVV